MHYDSCRILSGIYYHYSHLYIVYLHIYKDFLGVLPSNFTFDPYLYRVMYVYVYVCTYIYNILSKSVCSIMEYDQNENVTVAVQCRCSKGIQN